MLVFSVYGMSFTSLLGAWICHHGCEDAICVAVCIDGGCRASELAGGGNGLLTSSTIGGTGGDSSVLVGSTASQMNCLFLVYLAPELV